MPDMFFFLNISAIAISPHVRGEEAFLAVSFGITTFVCEYLINKCKTRLKQYHHFNKNVTALKYSPNGYDLTIGFDDGTFELYPGQLEPTSSPTPSPTSAPTSSPTPSPTPPTLSPTISPTVSPTTLSPTRGWIFFSYGHTTYWNLSNLCWIYT